MHLCINETIFEGVGLFLCSDARGRKIETILLEGVGLFLRSDARERKIETILLEAVGLFLCSDARGRKIETLDQGWGLGCCGETSYHQWLKWKHSRTGSQIFLGGPLIIIIIIIGLRSVSASEDVIGDPSRPGSNNNVLLDPRREDVPMLIKNK